MVIPLFFLAHWYGSLLAQTIFLHRYAAHRMYTLNKFWERVFFLLTYLAQGSSFLNPRTYAILHRLHHAHSDTEADPHSPVQHPNVFKLMWHTRRQYLDILRGRVQVAKQHLANLPTWPILEKIAEARIGRVIWGIGYISFYYFFAGDAWGWYLLLPVHFLMGPIHGAIVNWAGHKVGYRNYESTDNSRNTVAFDFITLGELFQNNHHKFPGRANFGKRWWEVDPGYHVLRFLDWVGIANIRLKQQRHTKEGRTRLKKAA